MKILAMLGLADVNEKTMEAWVDYRVVGLPLKTIAQRDGVSRNRIHQRVKQADGRIRKFLERSVV